MELIASMEAKERKIGRGKENWKQDESKEMGKLKERSKTVDISLHRRGIVGGVFLNWIMWIIVDKNSI